MNPANLAKIPLSYSGAEAEAGDDDLALVSDGPLAIVVINRPRKRNAMTLAIWQALPNLMQRLAQDDKVRMILFRGAGHAAFSAGADIEEFPEVYRDAGAAASYNEAVRMAQIAVERVAKPTLAVVRGACVGGGCGLALSCDLRFAGADARFGITPAKLGLAYSPTDTRRIVNLVGQSRAKDILFSGRLLGAEEALRIGMIDRAVPPQQIEQEASAYVQALLGNSASAIRAAKLIVNGVAGVDPIEEAVMQAAFEATYASDDFREGYRAFVEKRPPRFS